MKMKPILLLIIVSTAISMAACSEDDPVDPGTGDPGPVVLFSDDFEGTPCLSKWAVGGRQLEGTNTADCVTRGSSTRGHLFKFSFTKINIKPNVSPFDYVAGLTFKLELEVRVSSTGTVPNPDFFGMAEMFFAFKDTSDAILGHV